MDEYPPGVRAPGERYTGPIADPHEAMRAASASEDMMAQAAKAAADPDAPIRAYLSAMEVWKNPGKYAGYPWPEAVHAPSQAGRNADAIRAGMDRARAAGTGGGTREAANAPRTLTDETGLPGLENQAPDGTPLPGTPGATLLVRPIVPIRPSGSPVVDGLRTALAPVQGTTYGDVLPFAEDDATGDVRVAMPNTLRDFAHGVVDLLDGPRTGTVTPEATNALAAGMMGGLGRGAAAGGAEALSGRLLSAPGAAGKRAGYVPQPINGATRSTPLGFEQEAQFLTAVQELQSALKASGINDAAIGVRGSSVTGQSPIKGTTFHSGSDVDFFIESAELTANYKPSRNTPGFVHPEKIMRDYPMLREWSARWTSVLGRDITPGAFVPGTLPSQPAIVVK